MGTEVKNFNDIPEGMKNLVIKKNKYAKLTIIKKGNKDGVNAFNFLVQEWLPKSNYKHAASPPFIYYDERFSSVFDKYGYNGDPLADVYLPIIEK